MWKRDKPDLEFMSTDNPISNILNININIWIYVRGECKIIFMMNHVVITFILDSSTVISRYDWYPKARSAIDDNDDDDDDDGTGGCQHPESF